MLRPQGYSIVTDPEGPNWERDSITCVHCQRVIFVKPGTGCTVYQFPQVDGRVLEEMGAWCSKCHKPVCLQCHEIGNCKPWAKVMEELEAVERSARA